MNGMNKVFLMGYLGSDPKRVTSKSGANYTRFNLATHRQWRNAEGQEERRTDWHTVNVWGRRAENCADFLRKGSPVLVEGYLSVFEGKDESGKPFTRTSVTAQDVEFLARPKPKDLDESQTQELPF